MVKLTEVPRAATFAWSRDQTPILATGTVAGTIDPDFSNESVLELWSIPPGDDSVKPLCSLSTEAKFRDLDWSHDNKYIVGALDNGHIQLFCHQSSSRIDSVGIFPKKHSSTVKTVKFNPLKENYFISGGNKGEILVWDTLKAVEDVNSYNPTSAGTPMNFTTNEVSCLSWNNSLAHVFASTANTNYASVWDLKAKKEVIHLSYQSQRLGTKLDLSAVDWHPTNSTKLATASYNDNEPIVLVWDLRNSNTPLQELSQNGHAKGILSLDWCRWDENLLLSSGLDNTVLLWNPITGEKLCQYPTSSNWCFKTKFAPSNPDIFATTASDVRIDVQTLQNLTNAHEQLQNENNQTVSETDFWNQVSTKKVEEKPIVTKLQAPKWYGNRSPGATWAFGGKLIRISGQNNVIIDKPELPFTQANDGFNDALQNHAFEPIIERRLEQKIDNLDDTEDWQLFNRLTHDGIEKVIDEFLEVPNEKSEKSAKGKDKDNDDDDGEVFFANFEDSFSPSGSYSLSDKNELKICSSLVQGNFREAIETCLENDKLSEAFIIALDCNDKNLVKMVKNTYFSKNGSNSSLSRFLHSFSTNDVTDLIENLDISQWKYVAASICKLNANDQPKKNELLVKLGDKLMAADQRDNAILLYLTAQSLEKVGSVWLSESFKAEQKSIDSKQKTIFEAHYDSLNAFVEKFAVATNFVSTPSEIKDTRLISTFVEFVNIVASHGDFNLAFNFLQMLPNNLEDVAKEKERVLVASGKGSVAATSGNKKKKYGSMSHSSEQQRYTHLPNVVPPVTTPFAVPQPVDSRRTSVTANANTTPFRVPAATTTTNVPTQASKYTPIVPTPLPTAPVNGLPTPPPTNMPVFGQPSRTVTNVAPTPPPPPPMTSRTNSTASMGAAIAGGNSGMNRHSRKPSSVNAYNAIAAASSPKNLPPNPYAPQTSNTSTPGIPANSNIYANAMPNPYSPQVTGSNFSNITTAAPLSQPPNPYAPNFAGVPPVVGGVPTTQAPYANVIPKASSPAATQAFVGPPPKNIKRKIQRAENPPTIDL